MSVRLPPCRPWARRRRPTAPPPGSRGSQQTSSGLPRQPKLDGPGWGQQTALMLTPEATMPTPTRLPDRPAPADTTPAAVAAALIAQRSST
jgi:hypothetical protein